MATFMTCAGTGCRHRPPIAHALLLAAAGFSPPAPRTRWPIGCALRPVQPARAEYQAQIARCSRHTPNGRQPIASRSRK